MSQDATSLPYHEPSIVTILVQTSFLLLLNVVNVALDRVLYCGLLGQVLIGIAWGTPGAKWLSVHVEETMVQLGYLGLILLVFEGGLHTSFQSLKANLLLSSGVALTGIAFPIGLSYTLQGLLNATPVQAFAAGAALCSTSLGTTFTVLGSSGLSASRLGVVLTSAAMMDDVVGLVMVQVISNLGGDNFSWITIVRPILVSIAFAIFVPLACHLVIKPLTSWLNSYREGHPTARLNTLLWKSQTAFTIHTMLLIALVAGASYAGTSNLFAAYIAGASISWWDSELPHPDPVVSQSASSNEETSQTTPTVPEEEASTARQMTSSTEGMDHVDPRNDTDNQPAKPQTSRASLTLCHEQDTSGSAIYQQYYHPAVSKILQPLFFASIGFSIPITRMFRGAILWRGIVYTSLMAFAKFVCGLWLIRIPLTPGKKAVGRIKAMTKLPSVPHLWGGNDHAGQSTQTRVTSPIDVTSSTAARTEPRSSPSPAKPLSLHPPLILALAMCARGEIGFLISGVAESNGIFSSSSQPSDGPSDIFLVVTWAIVLCTIAGPLGVGLLVRRVKKLQEQKNKQQQGAGRDVLGVWGVE
ncbi:Sodium/hydrogen exchanger family-domain-containing protein [Pyrenochaeta sp. MPI-SDFR-AT-0127]|nr:Sodium/hydrogen exchanger family-domain-containing protein [Pyrenochaeta sp. MPI-SDFR-AT-0127]